jgi:Fe-S-cluster containining protein
MPSRWDCLACGECCRSAGGVPIFEDEAERFKSMGYGDSLNYTEEIMDHLLLQPKVTSLFRVYTIKTPCPLQRGDLCSIHTDKFISCKAFPFNRIQIYYLSGFMTISFNKRCRHYNEPDQHPLTVRRLISLVKPVLELASRLYGFPPNVKIHREVLDGIEIADRVVPKDLEKFRLLLELYDLSPEPVKNMKETIKDLTIKDYP